MTKTWLGTICFVAGIVSVPVVIMGYLRFGKPPVAVTDPAFPMEATVVHTPLKARIEKEMPQGSPVPEDAETLAAGATIYKQQCSFCHGLPDQPSKVGLEMYPGAPQLWRAHRPGVVGVSDDPVGETYWKVKNGIRLTGMPSYDKVLSNEKIWQVSLLLSAAAKPLPPGVQAEFARP